MVVCRVWEGGGCAGGVGGGVLGGVAGGGGGGGGGERGGSGGVGGRGRGENRKTHVPTDDVRTAQSAADWATGGAGFTQRVVGGCAPLDQPSRSLTLTHTHTHTHTDIPGG